MISFPAVEGEQIEKLFSLKWPPCDQFYFAQLVKPSVYRETSNKRSFRTLEREPLTTCSI